MCHMSWSGILPLNATIFESAPAPFWMIVEDLAIGRAVVPLRVGQIRRVGVLRRERAVAFAGDAVAERTVLLVGGCARGDRCRRRGHGILHRLGRRRGGARRLGMGREWRSEHRHGQHNSAHEQSRYAIHPATPCMPPRPSAEDECCGNCRNIDTRSTRGATDSAHLPRPESDNRFRIRPAGVVRWLAALTLIVTSACAPALVDTHPSSPVAVAAVTWNTHGGRGDLARLVVDLEQGRLSPRPAAFVLMLQETAEDELEAIAVPTTLVHMLRRGQGRRSCPARQWHRVECRADESARCAAATRAPVASGGDRANRRRRPRVLCRVGAPREPRQLVARRPAQRERAIPPG